VAEILLQNLLLLRYELILQGARYAQGLNPGRRGLPGPERKHPRDGFHVVIDLGKSHGTVIVNALEGKEDLDCYGYFATLPVGHSHPKLRDEGFRESLMTAAL
jgi:4-aminobutyrate aminotransferase-like enzyme